MKSKQSSNKKILSPFVNPFLSPSIQMPENDSSIDQSANILATPTSPLLCILLTNKYILLPHAPLCNLGPSGKSRVESSVSTSILLDYGNNQLAIANFQNSTFHIVSIFGTEKTWSENVSNIFELIKRIGSYIKSHPAEISLPSTDFIPVIGSLQKLIEVIYISKWDVLTFDKQLFLTIHKCVREKIMPIYKKQELKLSNLMSSFINSKEKSTILNNVCQL